MKAWLSLYRLGFAGGAMRPPASAAGADDAAAVWLGIKPATPSGTDLLYAA